MEFISNLIKRPISLVLSDSVEVSSSPTNSSSSSSNTNAQLREKCSPNNNTNSNSKNNNVQNMHKNNNNSKINMNCRNSPTTPDVAAHEANKNTMLPLIVDVGAGGDGLHAGHFNFEHPQHLNSSTSSNSTSSTIEELLIQINDNLNQATLQNQSDKDHVGGHDILSSLAALSPLSVKSNSSHKISQSPNLHTPTTPTVFNAPTSPILAAGSAVIDVNGFKIDANAVADSPDKAKSILNNNSTGITKKNKYVGLTEFDESKIPELPESLTPITDQVKLTFDEDLIPTLTASTQLNLPNKKDDATKTLQIIFNETDTAVSSDNETYAECQSFPDFTNTTNTIDLGYGENNTSLSEADTYRSALNSYNNTAIGVGPSNESNQLDETLENIADIGDEVFEVTNNLGSEEPWSDMMSTKNETQLTMEHNVTFNGTITKPMDTISIENENQLAMDNNASSGCNSVEPMDVDLNDTHEMIYTTNVTMESDSLNCAGGAANINELVHESVLDEYKNIPDFTESAKVASNDTKDADSFKTEMIPSTPTNHVSKEHPQMSDSHNELLVMENQTVVENTGVAKLIDTNGTQFVANEHSSKMSTASNGLNVIQDNSVDSATDAIQSADPTQISENKAEVNTFESQEVIRSNGLISSSMCDTIEQGNNKLCEQEANLSHPSCSPALVLNKDEHKVELPLEINTSGDLALDQKAPMQSPSFPIKVPMNTKFFPRSPDVPSKPMIFLEKSEYSVEDVMIVAPVKKDITTKVLSLSNLNKTVDLSDAASVPAVSPLATQNRSLPIVPKSTNNSSTSLNCTFDGASSLPSPTMTSSANKLDVSSVEKRRTFNATPTPNDDKENSLNVSRPNSRLTFNVVESEMNSSTMLTSNIASEQNCIDKRRTFNASPILNSQSDKASDSSRPNSRLTFNVVEPEETVNNQTVETMDIDSSMQAASSDIILPRSESPISSSTSVTCSTSSNTVLEQLSAKEQTKSNAKDEKDIFVEKSSPCVVEDMFKPPAMVQFNGLDGTNSGNSTPFGHSSQMSDEFGNEDFQSNLILNPSDFDYLLTKGNNNVQVDRSSLLLRFDPLLGVPIAVNQPQQQKQQLQQIFANNNAGATYLSPPLEEDEHQNIDNNHSFVVGSVGSAKPKTNPRQIAQESVQCRQQLDITQEQVKPKKNVRMSVDVIKDMKIENDCNKSIENSNTQTDDTENNIKMDELEKKIKNEVLKTEDIEKKLKEAEQREEALIKRITEKDKKITKMNDVIEAYEKAIAELISEKEQLMQNYEKQLTEVKADRDSNYHHLTSLETTFSDLHVKYEKSKEMTSQLKASEESLLAEKKQNLENLRLQEQRYEKMKNHAMQQLEIANKKLESLTKEHAIESTKLKALLKKEEISRASMNEQLQQKSRENAELVKICDELINGQGS